MNLRGVLILLLCGNVYSLYPRESFTREVKSLDGIWNFRRSPPDNQNIGFDQQWFSKPLIESGLTIRMPVPSSYNDITQDKSLRDYVGWVWYDTSFFAFSHWKNKRILLRFGSVNYFAVVYVNGKNVMNHTGGHLPFEADITAFVDYKNRNLLTVAVNNTLTADTIPQGSVNYKTDTSLYPRGFYEVTLNFDFFNYAGIHRSVHISIVPLVYINDINLIPGMIGENEGIFDYSIVFESYENTANYSCELQVWDKEEKNMVALSNSCSGNLVVHNATFWWPVDMHPNPGYLYNLKAIVRTDKDTWDEYRLKAGIRTVQFTDSEFKINGKPFYFKGFGKHEDSIIRGRGLDLPLIVKDFNLIKWIGANSFRTSHYPYSEELMDEADSQGIVVIDECPAVGLRNFNDVMLKQHIQTLNEMYQRDKNRPSVVMWSIANEPRSQQKAASDYFQKVVNAMKALENIRPVTAALNAPFNQDLLGKYLDVIMVNKYVGWYQDIGHPEVIKKQIINLFECWRTLHRKPIMMSEYGADAVAGLHQDPSFVFTEDYQSELIANYHEAFNELRKKNYFIGELIWNFADFMTDQELTRVFGNRKGLFTRERYPKAAAKVIRCRYHHLSNGTFRTSNISNKKYCRF